jgi:hypothetical protein
MRAAECAKGNFRFEIAGGIFEMHGCAGNLAIILCLGLRNATGK